jgi:hypothetical protein
MSSVRFRRECGNASKFREQDGSRDVAKASDALKESGTPAQDRFVVNEAPYVDEQCVDVLIKPRKASGN